MQDALNTVRPSEAPPERLETLQTLAIEVQTLPLASLAPAVVLLAGGLVLLLFGQRLLKPVLVVALLLASVLLAPPILALVFTSIGAGLATALGVLLGVIVAAITWRVALGAATGVATAALAILLVVTGVESGFIDARTPSGGIETRATATQTAAEDGVTSLAEIAARDERLARAPEFMRPLVAWADERWHAEPAQVRTLLKAAAAGGAFIGFVLGVWLPQSSAAFLTSIVGGLFTVSGAFPVAAHLSGRPVTPVAPIGWLLLWSALALAGWIFQSSRAGGARDDPDAPARP